MLFALLLSSKSENLQGSEINNRFWIDMLQMLLFYVSGMIYPLIIVFEVKKSPLKDPGKAMLWHYDRLLLPKSALYVARDKIVA